MASGKVPYFRLFAIAADYKNPCNSPRRELDTKQLLHVSMLFPCLNVSRQSPLKTLFCKDDISPEGKRNNNLPHFPHSRKYLRKCTSSHKGLSPWGFHHCSNTLWSLSGLAVTHSACLHFLFNNGRYLDFACTEEVDQWRLRSAARWMATLYI